MARKSKKATETASETSAPTTNATAIPAPDETPATAEECTAAIGRQSGDSMATVDRTALREALARLLTVVDRGSTMPILSHVAIRATSEGITLAGTDLNVTLTVEIPCTTAARGGACLPAKKLHEVIKSLDGIAPVGLDLKAGKSTIKSGRVRADLVAIHDRDFPKVPDHTVDTLSWRAMNASTVAGMLDSVLFSVCKDETRFHLNGVFVESTGEILRMVSTDGHRLTKAEERMCCPTLASGKIIPAKGATEIRRLLGALDDDSSCMVAFGPVHVFVRAKIGDSIATLTAKYIDAQFPSYDAVIPRPANLVTVDRIGLTNALKRAKTLSCETRGVRFEVSDGLLALVSDDPDTGTVREEIEADYAGKTLKIGFNVSYVMDLLAKVEGPKVVLGLGEDALDPGTIRSIEDATQRAFSEARLIGVVMPMRI